jgi:DNA polymerase-1
MIINADLKQVEIIIFAWLCKDPTLIRLIKAGQDMHRYVGSLVYDKPEDDITDQERSDIKAGNFGIIYGNGAFKLSQTTGRSEQWCKEFIEQFYETFPGAKKWHTEIVNQVNKTGQLKILTGETLKFKKYPAKYEWQIKRGIRESYNPPDIKNHPVQHTAYIITSMILGQLFRKAIHQRDKYLLINTVHDSFMIDSKEEYVDIAIKDITESVDNTRETIYNKFKVEFDLPLKVDISVGDNWSEL